MGVGVDGDQAAQLERLTQQGLGRIPPFGPGIDLHRRGGAGAGGEDGLGVEARRGPTPTHQLAPGAVAEDVGVGALDGRHHATGHGPGLHGELRVDTGHHDVEPGQQLLLLVESPVLQDVDLDAGEDPERGQLLVESGHDVELLAQSLGIEPVGHGEPGAVVGEGPVLVSEGSRAASAISAMGLPPSDQSEWLWQSPRSRVRTAAARPVGGGSARRRSSVR